MPVALAAIVGLIIVLVAVFPWTPGFDMTLLGLHVSAHTLGNPGGVMLAFTGLAMVALPRLRRENLGWVQSIDDDASASWDRVLPWGGVLAYLAISGSLKIKQHNSLQTHGGDLGIFTNICWNTLHGRWFLSSYHGVSFLSIHADLILGLLSPLLLIPHKARVMLIIQSAALALSLPPIYKITREITGKRSLGLAAILLFTGNPFILGMSQFDFHPEPLSIPLFLWAIIALRKNRWWAFWTLIMVALTVKEDMGAVVAAWGLLFVLFRRKHRGLGFALLTLGILTFLIDTQWIIKSHLPMGASHHMISRYNHLGATYKEVFLNLLNPLKLGVAFLIPWQKPWAVFRLLGWLLFLPAFSPAACLPAAAALLPHLLSSYDGQYQLTGSYPCTAFPFLFLAMAEAMNRLKINASPSRARGCLAAAAVAAGLGMIFSPRFVDRTDPSRIRSAYRLFHLVPKEASVRAQSELIPHLVGREHIQSFPFGAMENDEFSSLQNPDCIALELGGDSFPFTHEKYMEAVRDLEKGRDYELIFNENGFQLWKRKIPARPVYIRQSE
jgi:uncharacterized membrane protein